MIIILMLSHVLFENADVYHTKVEYYLSSVIPPCLRMLRRGGGSTPYSCFIKGGSPQFDSSKIERFD